MKQRNLYQKRTFLLTTVNIKQNNHKGKIEIEFFSKEDLERILDMLDTKQEL